MAQNYQFSQQTLNQTNVGGQQPNRTLIDSSSVENPIQLANSSNQFISQILTNTQTSPSRQSKTFVYRSESPIRSSTYGKNVVNVSTIQRQDAPTYISQSSSQNPIYVEKIVKVESSNTQEINILRQRINVLEMQNKTLTEELIELRNSTPQQVEQIVYIENNEEINRLRYELNQFQLSSQEESDKVKRSKKDADNTNNMLLQERERMVQQIRELTVRLTEIQGMIPSKDSQIRVLQSQNDALNSRFILVSAELEHLSRERTEVEPLKRKVQDLESYLLIQERTIEELRGKLSSSDQMLSQMRMWELRTSQQEQEINSLRAKIEEFLRTIQSLQAMIQQKDGELSKLQQSITTLNIRITQGSQVQQDFDSLKLAFSLKIKEIDDLKRRCADYEMLVMRIKQLEQKLQEAEQNNLLLMKKIEEINGNLNNETVKRSRKEQDLDSSLKDRQALEERMVHFTQQIEFMSRKIQSQEQEINQLRLRISELEQIARQVEGYENKIQFLTQQIERMNAVIVEKDSIISKLTVELNQTRLVANQVSGLQEEIRRLQEILNSRTNEIDSLRKKLQEQDVMISELRKFQVKCGEYENLINMLRTRLQEVEAQFNDETVKRSRAEAELQGTLRNKQILEEKLSSMSQQLEFMSQKISSQEKQLNEKDNLIGQLRQEIAQLQLQVRQLQGSVEEVRRLTEILVQKSSEIDALRKRISEFELALSEFRLIEAKLQECEKNNAFLRQRIAELESLLNDESVKRSRFQGDLEISLRDRQALEEKLVHLTQQIDFLSRKLSMYEQENMSFRAIFSSISQLLEEWASIQMRHSNFAQLLEALQSKLSTISTSTVTYSRTISSSTSNKQ